jgi:hypothetical protein
MVADRADGRGVVAADRPDPLTERAAGTAQLETRSLKHAA